MIEVPSSGDWWASSDHSYNDQGKRRCPAGGLSDHRSSINKRHLRWQEAAFLEVKLFDLLSLRNLVSLVSKGLPLVSYSGRVHFNTI